MAHDENETVVIEMVTDVRLRLYSDITAQIKRLGYNPCDYSSLGLGFELPADWPVGVDAEPTLAQLTVVARKLKMRIIIDHLILEPRKKPVEETKDVDEPE